ncbi:methionyl-tRNA formyltransferase [Schistosoma bovis]|uniref:Methionyl-tRNA formyltransferase n=1 Tax=Schistosoma bovis TaxID=6184 RepID=A0A430Q1C3_SCHBO|nr:methionyl-tRNA formyltransferase [Schistosoma bovis]
MGLINWQEQSAEDIIRYWHAFQGTCVNLFTELCLLNTVQEEKENNSLIANFRLSECPLLVPHVDHVSNDNNGQNNAEAADIYCPNYESKVMDYLNEASILLHQPHTSSLPPGSIVYLRSQKDVKHHLIPYTFIALNWPNSSTKSRHLTAIDLYNGYFLKYIQSLSSTLPISVVNKGRHSQQLGVRYFGEFRSNSSSTSSLLSGNNNGNTLIKPWNELTPTILPSDLQSSSDMSIIVKNVHS